MLSDDRHQSPRLRGVEEHFERIQLFVRIAEAETDAVKKFRVMIAAVYSCRASVELMLEAAEKQELSRFRDPDPKVSRSSLEGYIAARLPFYYLIERIRIHDFHRFGILPPNPKYFQMTFGGPVRAVAQGGIAAVSLTPGGPVISTTGGSQVKFQRPLLVQNGEFFDDETQRFVGLDELLKNVLAESPAAIEELKREWA